MLEAQNILLIRAGSLAGLMLVTSCLATGSLPTQVAYGCGEPKPRVVVGEFGARDDAVPEGVARGLTNSLVGALAQTGCFRMIDGTVAASSVAAGSASAEARRVGADLYVAGTITEFTADASSTGASADQLPEWLGTGAFHVATSRVGLSLRVVDPHSGEVVAASTVSGSAQALAGELTEEEHGYGFSHAAGGGVGEAMQKAVAEAVAFLVQQTHGPQIAAAN